MKESTKKEKRKRSQKLSKKNLPGHPSTFGSIMRLLPLFDKKVDMFVSINSRLPVTPLMKKTIEK